MTLDETRQEIENIDRQLIGLFSQRMAAVENVAELKKAGGLSITNNKREKELIDRVAGMVPVRFYYYAVSFYKHMIDLSKTLQRELINPGGGADSQMSVIINGARAELSAPRVAVQGVNGSFAMSAAALMYPKADISFVDSWEDVLYAVEDENCDYGVLPVENSSAGSVNEVFDLLIKYRHFIVKALPLPVDQCLLGIRGSKISDIKKIFSHPVAFPQCEEFLRRHHKIQQVPTTNTAVAAEFVAREGKNEYAAIASRECAHIYGLDIIADSIQQCASNTTRFISVSKNPEIPGNANKISIVITLPHVTGSLYRILSRFALNGLNLTKIESRPNTDKNFEYYFYIDFTGSIRSAATLDLLTALSEELPTFSFLGNYNEP